MHIDVDATHVSWVFSSFSCAWLLYKTVRVEAEIRQSSRHDGRRLINTCFSVVTRYGHNGDIRHNCASSIILALNLPHDIYGLGIIYRLATHVKNLAITGS